MQAMQAQQAPQKQLVRVKRAFYFNGAPTKVGETIELPSILARDVIAANKAEPVEARGKPEAAPSNKPVAEEKSAAAERKGGSNAR